MNQPSPSRCKTCSEIPGRVSRQEVSPAQVSSETIAKRAAYQFLPKQHAGNFSLSELLKLVGGSKATHYNRLNPRSPYFDPLYPRPVKNGRLNIYLAADVNEFFAARALARDGAT